MKRVCSIVILLYYMIRTSDGVKRMLQSEGNSRNGYVNYNTRPRFGSDSKKSYDIKNIYKRNLNARMRNMAKHGETMANVDSADSKAALVYDQRPKGYRPYRIRHRYFGGKRKDEEQSKYAIPYQDETRKQNAFRKDGLQIASSHDNVEHKVIKDGGERKENKRIMVDDYLDDKAVWRDLGTLDKAILSDDADQTNEYKKKEFGISREEISKRGRVDNDGASQNLQENNKMAREIFNDYFNDENVDDYFRTNDPPSDNNVAIATSDDVKNTLADENSRYTRNEPNKKRTSEYEILAVDEDEDDTTLQRRDNKANARNFFTDADWEDFKDYRVGKNEESDDVVLQNK